jgi:hypothetical protein
VYASVETLPGDTLYSVKIGAEQARKLLAIDDIVRIELELKSADERLAEIEALVDKDTENITLAVKGYEMNIMTATDKAESSNRDVSTEGMEAVAMTTLKHISMLDGINDDINADGKEPVMQAEEIAFRAQFQIQRSLAEKEPLRATEMNIVAMQNRLNRAGGKADEGESEEAERALKQFVEMFKFGEEISEIAKGYGHDTAAINALNTQARSAQLEIISTMSGKVSEEILSSAKKVMGISKEDNEKSDSGPSEIDADNQTPDKDGEPGSGPGEPDSDSGDPGDGTRAPGDGPGAPGDGPGAPGDGTGAPGDGPGAPGDGPEGPADGPGEPGDGPGPGNGAP